MTDAIQLESFDEESYYHDRLGFFARLRESRPAAPEELRWRPVSLMNGLESLPVRLT